MTISVATELLNDLCPNTLQNRLFNGIEPGRFKVEKMATQEPVILCDNPGPITMRVLRRLYPTVKARLQKLRMVTPSGEATDVARVVINSEDINLAGLQRTVESEKDRRRHLQAEVLPILNQAVHTWGDAFPYGWSDLHILESFHFDGDALLLRDKKENSGAEELLRTASHAGVITLRFESNNDGQSFYMVTNGSDNLMRPITSRLSELKTARAPA